MKLTKKELKNILKECFLEIIQEQNGNLISLNVSEANNPIIRPKSKENNIKNSADQKIQNPILKERVQLLAGEFHGNQGNLFQKILEDTALTTLQNQHEGTLGGTGLVDSSGFDNPNQAASSKEELKALSVDGDIKRWATVAFSKK